MIKLSDKKDNLSNKVIDYINDSLRLEVQLDTINDVDVLNQFLKNLYDRYFYIKNLNSNTYELFVVDDDLGRTYYVYDTINDLYITKRFYFDFDKN